MNRLNRIASIPLTTEAQEVAREYYERFLEDLLFSAKQLADFKRQEKVLKSEVETAHNTLRIPKERRVMGEGAAKCGERVLWDWGDALLE